jgi:DNA-binding transcriptional LysR family regulator
MGTVELDDIAVFVAVGESGSFSTAASRLGLPKSSVSRAIARLEAAMGVALVHRTTRHVALSTAGAALYERVAGHVRSIQQSLGDLPEREEQPSGRLRVTAPVDFGAAVMAEITARFAARYPSVEVEARLTNQNLDLVAEGIDVALRISLRRLKDSTLTARKTCPITIQLFAAPSYLARRGTPRTPRDLEAHEWVKFRGAGPIRLEGPGDTVSILPRGRIEADEMAFVRGATVAGAGIAILPTFLADGEVAAGRLVRLLPKWNIFSGDLWIVTPAGRTPRKVTAFVDLVLETLKARALAPRDAAA